MATWSTQDAKARFSELMDKAIAGEPQIVTRHGRPAVRVLSMDTAGPGVPTRNPDGTPYTFIDHLLNFPDVPDDFFERTEIKLRDIEF